MKVYGVSGYPYQEVEGGEVYFTTKAEAVKDAREASKDTGDGYEASTTTVQAYHISKLNADMAVRLLNRTSWCSRTEPVATFYNGRIVETPPEVEPR